MRVSFTLSFIILLTLAACKDNYSEATESDTDVDSLSSVQSPILIEDGSKAVYRFGKMTPRGMKYFFDTVDVKDQGIVLPDSLALTFLSPLSMSGQERDSVPGIIAISLPGFWEETIFGKIDHAGQLHITYIDEIQLAPANDVVFKPGDWSGVFRNDSITVRLTIVLSETADSDHLAGKGKLFLLDKNKLMEEQEVFLVYDKRTQIKSLNEQ
jgi:hypothetical protein